MAKWLYVTALAVLIVSGIAFTVSCSSAYQTTPSPATTQPAAGAPGATAAVVLQNFAFSPATLTVSAGTTVTWTNKDSATHTVTSTQGNVLNSPNMPQGSTFSFTFNQKGTFDYHCSIHQSMTGQVIVQ
jgi:plastocyanin